MFKPRGIPASELEQILLEEDELEAMRLVDMEGLHLEEAGEQMQVSRATMGRILEKARGKVAIALVKGWAIRIEEKAEGKI